MCHLSRDMAAPSKPRGLSYLSPEPLSSDETNLILKILKILRILLKILLQNGSGQKKFDIYPSFVYTINMEVL